MLFNVQWRSSVFKKWGPTIYFLGSLIILLVSYYLVWHLILERTLPLPTAIKQHANRNIDSASTTDREYIASNLKLSNELESYTKENLLNVIYTSYIISLIEKLAVVGLIFLGIISGFGSVYTPYTTMHIFMSKDGTLLENRIKKLESVLLRTNELIFRNMKLILELEVIEVYCSLIYMNFCCFICLYSKYRYV